VIRTVDLVILGAGSGARAAAISALRDGRRVLVVLRSGEVRLVRRLRRSLSRARNAGNGQVMLITNADVVCVDGVERVEAVIIRYARTGRLVAVNATAFVCCDDDTASADFRRGCIWE
jgi:thioredoxin reductase